MKPKYEKPKLYRLDEKISIVSGTHCIAGSLAEPNCKVGDAASNSCKTGNGAGRVCEIGNVAGGNCVEGSNFALISWTDI